MNLAIAGLVLAAFALGIFIGYVYGQITYMEQQEEARKQTLRRRGHDDPEP